MSRLREVLQLLLLIIGSLVTLLALPLLTYIYLSFSGALRSSNWVDTSCLILESTLRPTAANPELFQLDARIQHTDGSIVHSSAVLSREFFERELNRDSARAQLALYAAGAAMRCFVNPTVPHEVLLDGSPEIALSVVVLTMLLIPILPLLVGSQFRAAWRFTRGLYDPARYAPLPQCVLEATTPRRRLFQALFAASWAIITVVGTTVYFEHYAEALASNWQEQQCQVVFRGPSFNGADRDHDFVYSYSIEGKTYRSDDITPFDIGSPPDEVLGKLQVLNAGDPLTCYVSPSRPELARIVAPNPTPLLNRLFPLSLLAVACVIVTWLGDIRMRALAKR